LRMGFFFMAGIYLNQLRFCVQFLGSTIGRWYRCVGGFLKGLCSI